jgi:23S rRNA (adenine2503-C2)-methyltransferase
VNLLGALPDDLAAFAGVRIDVARRVMARVFAGGVPDDVPRVSKRDREALAAVTWERPEVVERVEDPESVRYLFRAADGAKFEAVRIPLEKPGAFSVCLSSQVGCAMACAFCATGKLGLTRDLTAAEIVGSFLAVRDEAPGRVTGAVFMGQGEPFHNYDAVLRAAHVLSDPCGGRVDNKRISISTVGLVPQIRRYTREGHKFRLVVSLHSAVPQKRATLVPRVQLAELAAALRERAEATGQRQTLAWVVMAGVNTGADEVEALGALFAGVPLRVNLIDVNGPDFARASDAERDAFVDALQVLRAPIVRRYSVGQSKDSACGMLAARPDREGAGPTAG